MSDTTPEAKQTPRVTVTAFGLSDPGRVRKNNEDAFLVTALADAGDGAAPREVLTLDASEQPVLLAVSDGMGGADAGEVASALVVESLRRAMQEGKGDWDEVTKKAVERANREVWDAARAPGRRGMGATVTAVCFHGTHAYIAEVGDSRAYLIRDGRVRQVTRDQSFVQYLLDAGALKPEEAEKYPMKNVVLQAMGQRPDVQVALGRLELRRGDRILLCSDGLSNMVKAPEMREILDHEATLDAGCRKLIEKANERGGEDNITVVVASVDGEGLAAPRAQESLTQTFQVLAEYKAAGMGLLDDEPKDDEPEESPPPRAAAAAPVPRAAPAAVTPRKKELSVPMILLAVVTGIVGGLLLVYLTRH
jgi:serine/threonine protein phosphatase PrpC